MSESIRVGIVGYGNLGRGVERALTVNPDMQLVGVFSRRPPASVSTLDDAVPVHPMAQLDSDGANLDLLILCGGSRDDLPVQSPELAAKFNLIDSFDTHARIPEHFAAVDQAARAAGRTALIAAGWDPGLFSLNRLFGEAVLPDGDTHTFWGRGLSQGHSDAIRRVAGVKAGVQYTVPSEEAIARVRAGERATLSTREKHERVCYVVLEADVDPESVKREIQSMPNYFADYDTQVTFISEEELRRDHAAMPHGGFVIRSGQTGQGNRQLIEYRLALESNPEFTASVLVAYGRATVRMNQQGDVGAKTVLDVPPGLLSPKPMAELRKELL
ncbi:MAG: diaminopimelate dehydrogenase [Novipirellula sp. JB048]